MAKDAGNPPLYSTVPVTIEVFVSIQPTGLALPGWRLPLRVPEASPQPRGKGLCSHRAIAFGCQATCPHEQRDPRPGAQREGCDPALVPCDALGCQIWERKQGGGWPRIPSSEATVHRVQRNDGKRITPLPCPSPDPSSPLLPLSGPLKIERGLGATCRLSDMNINYTLALSCLKLSVSESISTLVHLPCAAPPATLGVGRGDAERRLTARPTGLFLLGHTHTHLSAPRHAPSLFTTEGE